MYHTIPLEHSIVKGGIFEDISLTAIARGGRTLNCTHWEYQGKDKDYKVTKIKKEFTNKELCTRPSLLGYLKRDKELNKSFDKTEALIDGSSTEGTFQMTIKDDHPNSRLGAMKVTLDWNATAEDKMPLYYVVPGDKYSYWSSKKKPPSFRKEHTPEGWEGDDAMYAKIDFFVLEIPMTPDIMKKTTPAKYLSSNAGEDE